MRMGIGIGWPNASASNASYSFYITNCAGQFGLIYSTTTEFVPGIYLYNDAQLSIPFDGQDEVYNKAGDEPITGGYIVSSTGEVMPGEESCPL